MSFLSRLRRRPPTSPPIVEATPRWRPIAARVVTALAGLLLFVALVAPNDSGELMPGAFLAIPIEGLLGVALALVLPTRAGRIVAAVGGAVLGVLTIVKVIDMGFAAVLARPFDPLLDWTLFGAAVEFLSDSIGGFGATAAAIGAVLVAIALVVLMALSALRLTSTVARHRRAAGGTAGVLGLAWIICAAFGAQLIAGVPVAARSTAELAYGQAGQVKTGLKDQRAFEAEAAIDAFRDTAGSSLLTALRGKDVIFVFVESYGRDAVEDAEFAPQVNAVLDAGTRQLGAAGFGSRSAFLTSPTSGGASWLAHSTLQSGLWINNQRRYRDLVATDRFTLSRAFSRAGWRTVGVVPANNRAWPEGALYGYDGIYDSGNLGYQGPNFNFASIPDQYTLAQFQRTERAPTGRRPLMAEIDLLSSHAPWAPLPRLIDWNAVGDGSVYKAMIDEGESAEEVWRDTTRIRTEYRRSIEYSLQTLVSYIATYGDDDLVVVFLGDHQPAPIVTGEDASRDVPVTIVAHDHAVLDQVAGWGWQDGLKPGPQAPVWPMDAFRDRFLTAFGS